MSANEIFSAAIRTGNALITVTLDGVEYVAEAAPHTSPEAEAWKCCARFPLVDGHRVRHAAGLHAPGADGANLPALAYT